MINLLLAYMNLILKSIIHHKLKDKIYVHSHTQKLLGFEVQFFTYSQLINLFEEIFIYQVYNFDCWRNDPLIIDCGSNIGISVMYFKKKYPLSRIIAFEPDLETFNLLRQNVDQNKLINVSVYNLALSDFAGASVLYKDIDANGSLNMSIIKSFSTPFSKTVSTTRLSDYIDQHVDMLKIDVEGAEVKIIDDLIATNKILYINNSTIEYHPMITEAPVSNFILNFDPAIFNADFIKDSLHPGSCDLLVHVKKKIKN